MEMTMKIFERVIVSAELTGTGECPHGYIDDIYEFCHETFYSVRYDKPDVYGRLGTVTTNVGMLRRERKK